MPPADGDIRRRNVCREVIIVNKCALVGDFVHIQKMHGGNSIKFLELVKSFAGTRILCVCK
jgi:hypothetical protein